MITSYLIIFPWPSWRTSQGQRHKGKFIPRLWSNLLSLSSVSPPGRLIRCIRCPLAYHTSDSCVAAGSVILTHHIMICSNHGSAKKNGLLTSPVNVGWCFLCARGKLSPPYTPTNPQAKGVMFPLAPCCRHKQFLITVHQTIWILWRNPRSILLACIISYCHLFFVCLFFIHF